MNELGKTKITRRLAFLLGGGIAALGLILGIVYAANRKSAPRPTPDVSAIYTAAFQTALSNAPSPTVPTATTGPTAAVTPLALYSPKEDGQYVINVDIGAGVWQGGGTGLTCTWKITSATGDIISKYSGPAWGIVYIPPTGSEVTFEQCGSWTFLRGP